MNIFKSLAKLSAILFFIGASAISQAAPFTVTYTDTINASSASPPFNVGEAISITIVMDNGSTTPNSQTWTSADVVSITYSLNNGAITTVFSAAALDSNTGDFVTDASGVLTAVPSSWFDNTSPTIVSTNDPNTPVTNFFINGFNQVYGNNAGSASMTNVGNNIIAANWTNPVSANSAPTSVPTLSQWSLILLSLILVVYGVVRTRRVS